MHYRWRGIELYDMNLYDYTSAISIVKKKKNPDVPKKHRRYPNRRIPFMTEHPMSSTHEQMIRSKILVPQITRTPPTPPNPNPKTQSQLRKADRWAQHFGTLLFPWDLETGEATVYTYKQICHEVSLLRNNKHIPHNKLLLRTINSLSQNLKIKKSERRIMNEWRFEFAHKNESISENKKSRYADNLEFDAAKQRIELIRVVNECDKHVSNSELKRRTYLNTLCDKFNSYFPPIKTNNTRKPNMQKHKLCDWKKWITDYDHN